MRLTTELIDASLKYLNAIKEYELNLRGQRIPLIENLGAAATFEALDLTDNDLQSLGGFPLMKSLKTVLAARNRISHIAPNLSQTTPGMTTLQLDGNTLGELGDIDPLGELRLLEHLTLTSNPLVSKEHYRLYVIWRIPSLRYLDFEKIKKAERDEAKELFGASDAPTSLAQKLSRTKSKAFVAAGASGPTKAAGGAGDKRNRIGRLKLSAKESQKLQQMIRDAKTMAEVELLEQALSQGRMPPGLKIED